MRGLRSDRAGRFSLTKRLRGGLPWRMPRLTPDEIEAVLSRGGLLRIATTGADGFPLLVPVAFLFRDRRILLTARARVAWLAKPPPRPAGLHIVSYEGRYPVPRGWGRRGSRW